MDKLIIMVKEIVETFYNLAKQHKLIRSFRYDGLSKGMGIGEEEMIHFFLEDPIYFGVVNVTEGSVPVTVNFDILGTVQIVDNWDVKKPSSEFVQNLCYSVALNIIAKLREMNSDEDIENPLSVISYSIMTLHHYSDNDCDGVRVTLNCTYRNEINFCDVDEHFDESGEFNATSLLPEISTDNPTSCSETFGYKLPKIRL